MNIMKDYVKQLEKRIEELEETLQELEYADSIISILSSHENISYNHINQHIAARCDIEDNEIVKIKFTKHCRINMINYQKLRRSFDYFGISYREIETNTEVEPPF